MTIVDIVGFAAWLLNVAGLNITSWPMIMNALTFFGINVYGAWKWHREASWFEKQRRAA